jgi:hypothetical protein
MQEYDRQERPDRAGRPARDRPTALDQPFAPLRGVDLTALQRSAGNDATVELVEGASSTVHDVVAGGGRPLDPQVRADMERRLGQDFADVRVHTDGRAHESATAVQAHAYTVGNHVVFQRDAYDPASPQGRHTLAHELTHVVQQRRGPVDGTPAAGGVAVSHPDDRFEREAVATADAAIHDVPPWGG